MRQFAWRACYELLAHQVVTPDWAFMNYGYLPASDAVELPLEPVDEPDRLCIQLYEHTVTGLDLRGADLLEVGSGRGGGASYLSRYRGPGSTVGLDFSRRAVDLCRRHRHGPGLTFRQGDALDIPYPSSSFDVVVNVESSHCYSSMPAFVAEVHRVLRPGGAFCWTDLRSLAAVQTVRAQLRASGLVPVAEHDITARVLAALRLDHERKAQLVDELIPRLVRRPFRAFAGLQGTLNYDKFENGSLRYLSAQLRKDVA